MVLRRTRVAYAILTTVLAVACDTAYTSVGGADGDGGNDAAAGAADGAAIDGAVNIAPDGGLVDASSGPPDARPLDGALTGTGYCGTTGMGSIFCADFDESPNAQTGWASTQLGGGCGAPTLDNMLSVSAPASLQAAGSAPPSAASQLVTSKLSVTISVSVYMSAYLPTLPAAGDTWVLAQVAFDTSTLQISVTNAGISFDNTVYTGVSTGAWHALKVTYTASEITWLVDGSSGSNGVMAPGPFKALVLAVGVSGKNSGVVNLDNVQVR